MKHLFPLFFVFAGALCYMACSVNFQDPQDELDEIINEEPDWNIQLFEGEWISTYLFEAQNDKIQSYSQIRIEILKDSSVYIKNKSADIFPGYLNGTITYNQNAKRLSFSGTNGENENWEASLKTRLYFEGYYLNLYFEDSEDYIHFEKIPVPSQEDFVGHLYMKSDSSAKTWEYSGYRNEDRQFQPQDFSREITYYVFEEESVTIYKSLRGQLDTIVMDAEIFGDSLKLSNNNSSETYLIDYFNTLEGHYDSLRLWPLGSKNLLQLDSLAGQELEYIQFYASSKKNQNFVDLEFLTENYWRSDSMGYNRNPVENHFGQYYDLLFYANGQIKVITNKEDWPLFLNWNVENGNLLLETDSLNLSVNAQYQNNKLSIKGSGLNALLSPADSQSIAQNPLSRFPQQDYFHLFYGGDTLKYYFDSKCIHNENGADSIQIYAEEEFGNFPLGFVTTPGQNKDKLITIENPAYYIFTQIPINADSSVWIYSDTSIALDEGTSIRSTLDSKEQLVEGTLTEGRLRDKEGNLYVVSGNFRYKLGDSQAMDQNLWLRSKQ